MHLVKYPCETQIKYDLLTYLHVMYVCMYFIQHLCTKYDIIEVHC